VNPDDGEQFNGSDVLSFEEHFVAPPTDMADFLDGPTDEIQQLCIACGGISPQAAEVIAKWHHAAVEKESRTLQAAVLGRFVEFLLHTKSNPVRAWALGFASELQSIRPMTIAKIAKRLGISGAEFSRQKTVWENLLGIEGHGRGSKQSRSAYSEAAKKRWAKR
jgi:hypothetical protein